MTIAPPVLEPHRYTTFPYEREIIGQLMNRHDPARGTIDYTAVVEIGAYEGETTEELYPFIIGNRPYYVIDPWDGTQDGSGQEVYERFMARIAAFKSGETYIPDAGAGHYLPGKPGITVIRQRSQDVTPPPRLGFVYHDGDHREPDFAKWYDALLPGGVLVVHDYTRGAGWPEVRKACQALGPPWHEYRYVDPDAAAEYGPSTRGLWWKVKA